VSPTDREADVWGYEEGRKNLEMDGSRLIEEKEGTLSREIKEEQTRT
jgi:hypothetical protein